MPSTGRPLPEKEKWRAGRDREEIVRPQTQQAFRCWVASSEASNRRWVIHFLFKSQHIFFGF